MPWLESLRCSMVDLQPMILKSFEDFTKTSTLLWSPRNYSNVQQQLVVSEQSSTSCIVSRKDSVLQRRENTDVEILWKLLSITLGKIRPHYVKPTNFTTRKIGKSLSLSARSVLRACKVAFSETNFLIITRKASDISVNFKEERQNTI